MSDIPKGYEEIPTNDVPQGYEEVPAGRSWGNVPGEALENLVPSAGRFVKGIAEPILHPAETVGGISRVARGALGISPEEAPAWSATKQFFINRYGSEEALKQTIAQDPVGFAADISTILTGGGALAAKAPGMIGKVGTTVRAIGEAVNPIAAPLKAGAAVANKIAGSNIPSNLYMSALKPSTTLSAEERIKRVQTALSERIPVSEEGLSQLEVGIQGLNRDVKNLIAASTNEGKTISKAKLVDQLDELQNFYIENYADPRPYVGAIDRVKNGLTLTKPNDIPIGQAQTIKQSIYREIKDAYDASRRAGPTPALSGGVQGRKTLARAIKTEIENIVPEVKDLNARESAMIGLNESIERAVGRISNWDLLGLAAPVVGAAGGATPASKVVTAISYRILGNPSLKSRLAIALSKTRVAPSGAIPLVIRGGDLFNPNSD